MKENLGYGVEEPADHWLLERTHGRGTSDLRPPQPTEEAKRCEPMFRELRVYSLLYMLESHGATIALIIQTLQTLRIARFRNDDLRSLFDEFPRLRQYLNSLEMKSSVYFLNQMNEKWQKSNVVEDRAVTVLDAAIEGELASKKFLFLPAKRTELYEDPDPLGIRNLFPTLSSDAQAAARCLALREPKACVFHLMVVVEGSLKELGKVVGADLAEVRMWQALLNKINPEIEILRKADPHSVRVERLAALSSHLYNLKLAWRNPTMHPGKHYSDDEAEEVFNATKVYFRTLMELLPEETS